MMHPFSGLETSEERRKRISLLVEDVTDKEYAEKLLNGDYFFPTTVDEALCMLESLLLLIKFISIENGTVASEGYELGAHLIKKHQRCIHIRQEEDKLRPAK